MAQSKAEALCALPTRPSMEYLKKLAKQRLVELKRDDLSVRLALAQMTVAREHGFVSWRKLSLHVQKVVQAVELESDPVVAALHEAIRAGELNTVIRLLEQDASLVNRVATSTAQTPLHAAALHGQLSIVELLLTRGADPTPQTTWDESPLGLALIRGHARVAIRLAQVGWDRKDVRLAAGLGELTVLRRLTTPTGLGRARCRISVELPNGHWTYEPVTDPQRIFNTCLEDAARNGQVAAIDLLLERGADLHAQGFMGSTPLHRAVANGKLEAVAHLVQCGADPRRQDPRFGGDALGWAREFKQAQVEQWLAAHLGLSVAAAKIKPRRRADWKPLMDAAYVGDVVKVCSLLDGGADPNVQSSTAHRHRPLHRTIEHKKTAPKHEGHDAVVQVLLERGADPRLEGTYARVDALQLAAEGEPRFVPLLLPHFKPLNFFQACSVLDVRRVSALLKRNSALATTAQALGRTPLHCCAASKLYQVDAKHAAAQMRVACLLLEHGADVSGVWLHDKKWPISVLYHAAGQHGNAALAELLMDRGADPCDGESVYHAAEEGHEACLALFAQRVDPERLAQEATVALRTQMHWGVTRGAKWLLEHGADPNSPHGSSGRSALQSAAHHGSSAKVISLLLQRGGDPWWENNKGESAIDVARVKGKTQVIKQLQEAS